MHSDEFVPRTSYLVFEAAAGMGKCSTRGRPPWEVLLLEALLLVEALPLEALPLEALPLLAGSVPVRMLCHPRFASKSPR